MRLFLAVLFLQGCGAQSRQLTILVSIDGFRWDYPDKAETPTLDQLARNGVRAERLIPCFPSKTFPNHYSIATGLYPENHGITANNMYDRRRDRYFAMSLRDAVHDPSWWQGEPIWVTAEKQGVKTAPFFWVGSETEIKGRLPSYWLPFQKDMTNVQRVDQIFYWLDLPVEQRPVFLTLYFDSVDDASHAHGPDSELLAPAIAEVDSTIRRLVNGLQERGLFRSTNLVILSDHGHATLSPERVIYLDDYVNMENIDVVDWNPVASINPAPGKEQLVLRQLVGAHPHLQVYHRSEIPERFHYRRGRNIADILALADEGWSITSHETVKPRYVSGGTHGYDNQLISMGAAFIAHGPAFKSGITTGPFQNIHIYELLAHLLKIRPAANDGSLDSVRVMLRSE